MREVRLALPHGQRIIQVIQDSGSETDTKHPEGERAPYGLVEDGPGPTKRPVRVS